MTISGSVMEASLDLCTYFPASTVHAGIGGKDGPVSSEVGIVADKVGAGMKQLIARLFVTDFGIGRPLMRLREICLAFTAGMVAAAAVGCAPSDPYSRGYIIDLAGSPILRTVSCVNAKTLLFESATIYPVLTSDKDNQSARKPVWSAVSQHGVGFVILGANEQAGLRITSSQPIERSKRYSVHYLYTTEMLHDPLDLRISDLTDGMAVSALGVTPERAIYRKSPSAFGCP